MPSDQVVKIVDNRLFLNVEPVRKYPVLRSDNSITLYVDGQPKKGPIIISNAEEIKFEIAEHNQSKLFDFEVSQDKLRVYLTVNRLEKGDYVRLLSRILAKLGIFSLPRKRI